MKNNCLSCYCNDFGYCTEKDELIYDMKKERFCYLPHDIEQKIKRGK